MMRKKRVPHLSALKPHPESTRSKVPSQIYISATNYARVCAEYCDSAKDAQGNMNINRSISLNKPTTLTNPKRINPINTFGCTYFGQGFLKAPPTDGKPNPSPYSQQKSSAYRKTRINSMHKTANYWNASSKTKYAKSGVGEEYEPKKRQEPNSSRANYPMASYLPSIEQKTVHFTDVPEPDTNDTYIRYVTQIKRSRAIPAYANRSKEGEQGQIVPLEKKPNNPPSEEARAGIRVFNWEGIHFEVSPKRDSSCDSTRQLQQEYANDMNLMLYNFNGSMQPRNGSESPKPDGPKKISCMHNKTSHNFAKPWKRGNAAQSPLGSYPFKTSKPPIDRIEEEPEQLHNKPYNSPRQPVDTKIRLENEARRQIDRPEEQNSRRKKSPPPLTPITNNSTFCKQNHSIKKAEVHNITAQTMRRGCKFSHYCDHRGRQQ